MFEVELKFRIDDREDFRHRLAGEGAVLVSTDTNADSYYNHPCRDFAETGEALRVRREGDVPMITYKAAKLPGTVKAREELEWRLDPGDADGTSTETLLQRLGFRRVAIVTKHRTTFRVGGSEDPITVTMDEVEGIGPDGGVGHFAEIEQVIPSESPTETEIRSARESVSALANRLGLSSPESRSYLRMLLER